MAPTTFHTKVQQIAAHLYPWRMQSEHSGESWVALVHPHIDGAQVSLRLCDRGRIAVSGAFPKDFYPRDEQRPRITVSVDRGARSIAEDIMRRFLPAYIRLFGEMAAHAQAWAAAITEQNGVLDEVAVALGVEVHRYYDEHQEGEIYAYGCGSSRARVQTSHLGGEVTVSLDIDRVPVDLALEVSRLLRPMFDR